MLYFVRAAFSPCFLICSHVYCFCRDGAAAAGAAQAAVDQIIVKDYVAIFADVSPANPVKLVGVVFAESGRLAAIQSCDFDGVSVVSESVVKWHCDPKLLVSVQRKSNTKKV
jgi:hypothetical protein